MIRRDAVRGDARPEIPDRKTIKGEMMNGRIFWILLIIVTAGGALSYFLGNDDDQSASPTRLDTRPPVEASTAQPSGQGFPDAPLAQPGWAIMSIAPGEKREISSDELHSLFSADQRGDLVINETTRLSIEKLYALHTPEEREAKVNELSGVLPSEAHRQLVHFLDYFDKYVREAKIIYPPEAQTDSVDAALDQLDGLHDLRVSYFGADVAEAFFGREERVGRRMLDLMRLEKDDTLSLEEKAYRAKLVVQEDPEFAAAHSAGPDGAQPGSASGR